MEATLFIMETEKVGPDKAMQAIMDEVCNGTRTYMAYNISGLLHAVCQTYKARLLDYALTNNLSFTSFVACRNRL